MQRKMYQFVTCAMMPAVLLLSMAYMVIKVARMSFLASSSVSAIVPHAGILLQGTCLFLILGIWVGGLIFWIAFTQSAEERIFGPDPLLEAAAISRAEVYAELYFGDRSYDDLTDLERHFVRHYHSF